MGRSVTVPPRARHPTEKCIVEGERHNHSSLDVLHVVSARNYQSIDTCYPSAYHNPQLSIQGVLTRNWPTFLADGEPAQYFRASHNHHADPTIAVVTTAISKPTETNDLGPHNMGSVHPFFHPSLRGFFSPRISFFVFTKDVCGPYGSTMS